MTWNSRRFGQVGAGRRGMAIVVAVALATLSAACGARLSDDERAAAISTGNGGSQSSTDGTSAPLSDGDVVAPVDGGTTGPAVGSTGGTDGGTTGSGTTGTATGGTTGGPAACTPGSATSTGVTPTEVKVGNVSQLTGLVPGFGQTSVNGVKAYFAMVNSRGGVCGRKLTLIQADDRFQSATNRSETEKLTSQVIGFAGSLSVVDDGGGPVLDQKNVADVSLATTTPRITAKNSFPPNPIDPSPGAGNGTAKILKYLKDTLNVRSGAIFYQDVATGVNQSKTYAVDFQTAGIPLAGMYAVAPTATNFRSQASDIKQKQIDLVITIAEVNAIANLAKAFADVAYFPKVPFYGAQVYGKKYIQLAGSAAENTVAGLIFAIPEETNNPGIQAFNTWYQRAAPGADVDFFAIVGWVAAEMFVRALTQAGPDPTQAKLLEQLRTFTSYSSDMVAQINPAQKKSAPCFQIATVKGGKWTKTFPAQGFACP